MTRLDILVVVLLTLMGPGFLLLGIRNLRARAWREGVPAVELLIVRMAGAEPRPRTRLDRALGCIHAWLLVIFGAFFSFLDIAVIFSFVSE